MTEPIPMQLKLDSPLPIVIGNEEYSRMELYLNFLLNVIENSKLDALMMQSFIDQAQKESPKKVLSHKIITRLQEDAKLALRISILRKHLRLSVRTFGFVLASSPLFQSFCGINRFLKIKALGKSKINSLENSIPEELVLLLNKEINKMLFDETSCKKIGFAKAFELKNLYMDSTCVKANIHYPVDWVLFRDLIRTAMLQVAKIRDEGFKVRMPQEPIQYLSDINTLCIEMGNTYRILDGGKKKRKMIFREMKRLLKTAMDHSKSHFEKYTKAFETMPVGLASATRILNTLKDLFEQYPDVVKIAHKRIISEKFVAQEDKILSIYEGNVHIITKHKDGMKSEFGNTLQIVEQQDGFIVDYDLLKDYSPGDAKLGIMSIDRIDQNYGLTTVASICGDRGCDAKSIRNKIEEVNKKYTLKIENDIAPRQIDDFNEKMKLDESFGMHLKRRASTEARVAAIKRIAGNPMLQKGIENKKVHLGLAVLTHNLFKAAKIYRVQQENTIKEKQKSA